MADESNEGNQNALTWRCTLCTHAFGFPRPAASRVQLHYDADHPGIAPATCLPGGECLGLLQLEELDRRERYARVQAPVRTDRACFICGVVPAATYEIVLEGIRGATPNVDLCGEHGALFLMRTGMVLGEMKANYRARKGRHG